MSKFKRCATKGVEDKEASQEEQQRPRQQKAECCYYWKRFHQTQHDRTDRGQGQQAE